MAVLCQRMVQPKSAGILFTIDPAVSESGRMLISAVNGLGVQAVNGSDPADIYRPLREGTDTGPMNEWAQVAEKTHRTVAGAERGLEERELSESERNLPVLSEEEIRSLVRLSRRIESLIGRPQDIEWAISDEGDILGPAVERHPASPQKQAGSGVCAWRGPSERRGLRLAGALRGQGQSGAFDA